MRMHAIEEGSDLGAVRVHYGLWPSDSPEQLRCDGGGEMLRNQIDVLSARLTRKLRTEKKKG